LNPETNEIFLDINTAAVIPREPAAGYSSGYVADYDTISTLKRIGGFGTGDFAFEILDPMAIQDTNTFQITFDVNPIRYSIEDLSPIIETRTVKENVFITLKKNRLNASHFILKNSSGTIMVRGKDYLLFPEAGQVVVTDTLNSNIKNGEEVTIEYTHYALWESRQLNNEESNPVIDGVKIYVKGESLSLNSGKSKWTDGSTGNYAVTVGPFDGKASNMRSGDYEIRWSNNAEAYTDTLNNTMPFEIWNVTPGLVPFKERIVLLDYLKRNKKWDIGEDVALLEIDPKTQLTWLISFAKPGNATVNQPIGGDVYYIATNRPFTSADIYQYQTQASAINPEMATNELDDIRVVPNPYVVTNILEPLDRQNPRDRGPRKIYFDKLPNECTIRIYTTTGELVKEISHTSAFDDGQESWDLTTKDNFPIAYGVYIYHIDAGELGEKIGRLAVIK
jgi:hypothetical protein